MAVVPWHHVDTCKGHDEVVGQEEAGARSSWHRGSLLS